MKIRGVVYNFGKQKLSTCPVKDDVTVFNRQVYYQKLGSQQDFDSKPNDWDDALPFEKIPGPKPLPIIGNTFRFLPYIGDFYGVDLKELQRRFYKQYGRIAILKDLKVAKNIVLLYSPEDIEKLHRNEGVWPHREVLNSFTYYRNILRKDIFQGIGGVATVQGEDWFNIRSKVNPILMQPRMAHQYIDKMDEVAEDLVKRMRQLANRNKNREMPPDFIKELNKWALEAAGLIALDRRLGCLDDLVPDSETQKLVDYVIEMFWLIYQFDVLPSLWKYISTPLWKRYITVLDYITLTFVKYIDETAKNIGDKLQNKAEYEMSILERLLKLDPRIAKATAIDTLTAGIDTTGKTTGAALYFLARNPKVQTKLREELCRVLPTKETPVTKEILAETPYLKAVIKETTRFCPIAIVNIRKTLKDLVLGGYQIPKGTIVHTANGVLSLEEEHFVKSKEFIPERWIRNGEKEISCKNTHPFVFLPFGYGPRACLGKRLANMEMEIVLARIIRNLFLEWPHADMKFTTTLVHGVGDPLKLRVTEVDK
ncbi:probable cytochrome P450 12a5, mitochondrial isoform X2 [Agrilus planipennis]|nr:probable cytochrome P450 12a5, mitochondrial isoform X2 [Agrilus planipennis]